MCAFSETRHSLGYAFFPRRCAFCGCVIDPADTVCGRCAADVPRVEIPICYSCGCGKTVCVCAHAQSRFVAATAAPFYYMGSAETAILRMKFRGEPELSQALGDAMAAFAQTVYDGIAFDVVTFVPMTQKEQKQRGFNQSELLACRAADRLGLPCEATLYKLYETRCQRTLRQRQRSGNVLGVFDVCAPDAVRGRRVLLCDDLRTTGATLHECAKMLCLHGAREVFCLTAAVTFPKIKQEENEHENQ